MMRRLMRRPTKWAYTGLTTFVTGVLLILFNLSTDTILGFAIGLTGGFLIVLGVIFLMRGLYEAGDEDI